VTDRDHWFEDLADHLGSAYDRYAHTKGTVQEVDHVVAALDLRPVSECSTSAAGPAVTPTNSHGAASWSMASTSASVSSTSPGRPPRRAAQIRAVRSSQATFERGDARSMAFEGEFDAVICLCQGAFGMMTADGEDAAVVAGMARALRPGGRLALSAFNAYFAVKYHVDAEFDATTGVSHEITEIRSETGEVRSVDLWTGCYTPRELRLLLAAHGFVVDSIASVEPGAYGSAPATTESPEFLVVAHRHP
jgi:SAM-dependent methyltransferase